MWSVEAKGSWEDLLPLDSEVVGYWSASRQLHYHIRGAPMIYGFVDHKSFAAMYQNKEMSAHSPRMFKLMQELMEYPFLMEYMPGWGRALFESLSVLRDRDRRALLFC